MPPLVSIIIPCFNGEDYIAEAIQSALNQTHSRIEVIVVDDGSTDNSLAAIDEFHDRIIIETGPNVGGSAARNRGVEIASGEFVQFLDADDLLSPDKVSQHLYFISEQDIGGTTITVSQGQAIDLETGAQLAHFRWEDSDPLRNLMLRPLQTSAPLHPVGSLKAVGGFTKGLSCCQEKDLHLRLALAGFEFVQFDFVGYTQRRREGSVSGNPTKVYRVLSEVLMGLRREIQQHGNWRLGLRYFRRDLRTLLEPNGSLVTDNTR